MPLARGDMTFGDALSDAFGAERVRTNVRLASFTTFKVGGPADWLVQVRGGGEVLRALDLARRACVPVTAIGGGSNVLVSDRGVRGLVLRIHGGDVGLARDGRVRSDAGVTLNGLVRWTLTRGLGGLEMWAGTPGTVGGAVYGNAHFQGRLIGDQIEKVGLVSREGDWSEVLRADMEFGYDFSRLHRTREVVVWAEFLVSRGEPTRLREAARQSIRFRKHTQPLPLPSAGCIFQNPDPARDGLPPTVPPSAGALIDRAGLKGARIGDALVSPTHANFIVNTGAATAGDVRALIEYCRRVVRERFGVTLREEVTYLGDFDDESAYVEPEN
jgi:UDP-N-acetylmuramate dehydrogenase